MSYFITVPWKLPKGAFYGTAQGRTIFDALDDYADKHGSAVGVWHVTQYQEHYIFAQEADARAYIDETAKFRKAREVQHFKPADVLTDPTSGRKYRGEQAGENFRMLCPAVGVDDEDPRFNNWESMRLYQRTEEMERGRFNERLKKFMDEVERSRAVFADKGPIWTDTWEGLLSQGAKNWGRRHGYLSGMGKDLHWTGDDLAGVGTEL